MWLPPVEIFISNGVTYTITRTEGQWATTPVTTTSSYNDVDPITSAAAATTPAAVTTSTTPAAVTTSTTPAAVAAEVVPSFSSTLSIQTDATSLAQPSTQAVNSVSSVVPEASTQVAQTSSTAGQVTLFSSLAVASSAELVETSSNAVTTQQTSYSAAQTTISSSTIQITSTSASTSTSATSTSSTSTSSTSTSSTSTSSTQQAATSTYSSTSTSTSTTSTVTTASPTTTSVSQTTAQTTTSTSTSSSSSGSLSPPSVIVYSPYNNDGTCKDYDSIETDLTFIQSKGISKLRIYGADCATFTAVLPIASTLGMTVNQGLWISSAGVDSIDDYTTLLISYGQTYGWDVFDFITVGNEAVNAGYVTVAELIAKISSVKTQLNNAGYSGLITTSEPPATFIASPELCTESEIDFVGINPHSYFNENLYASDAGSYITSQQSQVAELCSKLAFITETGYPSQGDTNGNNVPSVENQYIAIQSIIEYTGGDVTILTTYDDFWKEPGPYGIEQYFGTIQLFT